MDFGAHFRLSLHASSLQTRPHSQVNKKNRAGFRTDFHCPATAKFPGKAKFGAHSSKLFQGISRVGKCPTWWIIPRLYPQLQVG